MEDIILNDKKLKNFGMTMGIAMIAISLFLSTAKKCSIIPFIFISAVFFISAVIRPSMLKFVYIGWMKLALVLNWVNTRVLLILIFYLVFTPLGLLMKLFGKDLLDREIQKIKPSYWQKTERQGTEQGGDDTLNYERQF